LYEPFHTTKANEGGSGLGLSIVKTIVQQHGGTIDFTRHRAKGCTVNVVLPRRADDRLDPA
jgi:signal transduction histidine kinase